MHTIFLLVLEFYLIMKSRRGFEFVTRKISSSVAKIKYGKQKNTFIWKYKCKKGLNLIGTCKRLCEELCYACAYSKKIFIRFCHRNRAYEFCKKDFLKIAFSMIGNEL